jgi:adenosylcobinamide kinase/adenosylcobinamide-phosphate guanylyltransferase
MWLISGGAYQGKLAYVLNRKQIPDNEILYGETCEFQDMLVKPLVTNFHLWIKRMLLEEKDVTALVEQLFQKNPDIIIIVDELGCGIVPMDVFDRRFREITGRICCQIAKDASEVHRVLCGIGTVIKHA